jgi:hypothetical protein
MTPAKLKRQLVISLCASLAFVACDEPSTDVELLFDTVRAPAALSDPSLLRVRLEAGGRVYRITGNDLRTDRYSTPHTDRLTLPTQGELLVSVALVHGASDTLGAVRTIMALQPDYRFGVNVTLGGARPLGVCVGRLATAVLRRPGSPTATDTLWVSVGGLPRGAVC